MKYTAEEIAFIRENIADCESYDELTTRLNAAFGSSRKMERVREKCNKSLHMKLGKNAGTYGKRERDQLPIGTIRKSQTGTYIKVSDARLTYGKGYQEPMWMPLQKKIYQDAYGEVPDGYMVIFLNCNTDDFRLENLYAIDRRISAQLASNGWYSKNPDVTKAAIKLCELMRELKT